jgi:hypothetical protein
MTGSTKDDSRRVLWRIYHLQRKEDPDGRFPPACIVELRMDEDHGRLHLCVPLLDPVLSITMAYKV